MSLILSGTDGLSDVDGSASTPAIRGTDTNTGIFFPAADTIAFAEGGAEVARFDSSGQLNIGSTTQNGTTSKVYVRQATDGDFRGVNLVSSAAGQFVGSVSVLSGGALNIAQSYLDGAGSYQPITLSTGGSERMRIDSSGRILMGTTTTPSAGGLGVMIDPRQSSNFWESRCNTTGAYGHMTFFNPNGNRGEIQTNGTNLLLVNNSDYRLKENVMPMVGALDKVAQLKPCTYTWKVDGSNGQGFIAHELQAVVPDCVSGEKDAVNEDGSIKPQGIDTSFLVATLTAAIQEQQAIITDLKARLEVLEAK